MATSSSRDEPGHPTGYLLTKVAQATTARFARALAELGLRPKHYGLLAAVATAPGASQQQLGRMVGVVPSAIVTMVDDLQELGALERAADPASRRQFAIGITASGRDLLERATRLGAAVDDEVLAGLSPTERARLTRTLAAVAAGLGLVPAGSWS